MKTRIRFSRQIKVCDKRLFYVSEIPRFSIMFNIARNKSGILETRNLSFILKTKKKIYDFPENKCFRRQQV